ncbi:hypothetical protein AAVH_30541, partial [Aphelenchoides avenae]
GSERACRYADMHKTYINEMGLLRSFLCQSTEIMKCMRSDVSAEVLAQHFFVIWVTMENLIATMRRSGFARNQLVFVDGSSLDITHDSFIKACLSDPDISDPSIVASLCVEKFRDILMFSEHLRRCGLDDAEIAALSLLTFAHYESKLFANPEALSQFVNSVFRDLHKHYLNTYDDHAIRLGNIASLMGEFHLVQHYRHEVSVIVALASNTTLACSGESEFDCRMTHRLVLKG